MPLVDNDSDMLRECRETTIFLAVLDPTPHIMLRRGSGTDHLLQGMEKEMRSCGQTDW